jgi:hypothetical protein
MSKYRKLRKLHNEELCNSTHSLSKKKKNENIVMLGTLMVTPVEEGLNLNNKGY